MIVPCKNGKYIYYVGASQKSEEHRNIFCNIINYYHNGAIFKYPYEPMRYSTSIDYDNYYNLYNSFILNEDVL